MGPAPADFFVPLVLLAYGLLILAGFSALIGQVVDRLAKGKLTAETALPLGFSLAGVVVTYGGYLGIGRVPGLIPLAGLALACYGVRSTAGAIRGFERQQYLRFLSRAWFPLLVLATLFAAKLLQLFGHISDGEEARSIMFTAAFATNHLRPAYPFDFSIPVAYPYAAFELSGFLYGAVRGFLYPSIATYAISLFTIGLFFHVLFIVCRRVFVRRVDQKYLLTCALFTFAGWYGFRAWPPSGAAQHVGFQLLPLRMFLHSGYHYVWGAGLILLAVLSLVAYFEGRERTDWALFIASLSLAQNYSGIPFGWGVFGILPLVLGFLVRGGKAALTDLLRRVPDSLAIAVLIFAPQFWNFLPRFWSNFRFSAPHLWFPNDLGTYFPDARGVIGFAEKVWFIFDVLMARLGFFLIVGLAASVLLAIGAIGGRRFRDVEWRRVIPFATIAAVGALLLTVTTSTSGVWYSRGFIVPAVAAVIVAAKLFHPYFFSLKRRLVSVLLLGILLVQGAAFFHENRPLVLGPDPHVVQINRTYPLGTVFYQRKDRREIYYRDEPYGELMARIHHAGRALIMATPAHHAFLNCPEVLSTFGITAVAVPCTETIVGGNVPLGSYVEVTEDGMTERGCP